MAEPLVLLVCALLVVFGYYFAVAVVALMDLDGGAVVSPPYPSSVTT